MPTKSITLRTRKNGTEYLKVFAQDTLNNGQRITRTRNIDIPIANDPKSVKASYDIADNIWKDLSQQLLLIKQASYSDHKLALAKPVVKLFDEWIQKNKLAPEIGLSTSVKSTAKNALKMIKELGTHYYLSQVTSNDFKELAIKSAFDENKRLMQLNKNGMLSKKLSMIKSFFVELRDEHGYDGVQPIPDNWHRKWFYSIENNNAQNTFTSTERILSFQTANFIRTELFPHISWINTRESFQQAISNLALSLASFVSLRTAELQAVKLSNFKQQKNGNYVYEVNDSWRENKLKGTTKNGKNRTTNELPKQLVEQLVKLHKDITDWLYYDYAYKVKSNEDFAFPSLWRLENIQAINPITGIVLNKQLKEIIQLHDLPEKKYYYKHKKSDQDTPSVYWLRHTVATELVKKFNGDYVLVSKFTGHDKEILKNIYANHVQPDILEDQRANSML